MNDVVYVTVPAGVLPGQTLSVQLPDGLTMSVVVPDGMTTGSIFGVQAPQYSPNPNQESEQQVTRDPAPPSPVASPVEKRLLVRVPWGTPPGATVSVDIPDEPWRTITVQVPPNVTEFHVAYVPTIYSEVHAERGEKVWQEQPTFLNSPKETSLPPLSNHEPKPQAKKSTSLAPMDIGAKAKAFSSAAMQKFNSLKSGVENSSFFQPTATEKPHQSLGNAPPPFAPPGTKLLLVRVPLGTTAGTMLTVEVPDNPGVTINVEVPPNVTEFHVAYMENNTGLSGSTNAMNSEKLQQQQQQQYPPMAQTQVSQNWQQKPVAPQKQQQSQHQQSVVQEDSQEVLRLQRELKAHQDKELERLRQERRQQHQQYMNAGLQIGVAFTKAAIGSYFSASDTTSDNT